MMMIMMMICTGKLLKSGPDHIGTTWGDLKDEVPNIMRAEAMAWAKKACEPIYKRRATLKGKQSPQN